MKQEKTGELHDWIGDMLQIAEKERWSTWQFITLHDKVLLEYHDRRGQYGWETYDQEEMKERHHQYYELDEKEEEVLKMEGQDFKVKITAMGSKTATVDFKMRWTNT